MLDGKEIRTKPIEHNINEDAEMDMARSVENQEKFLSEMLASGEMHTVSL